MLTPIYMTNVYDKCTQYVHMHVYMLTLGDTQKEGRIKSRAQSVSAFQVIQGCSITFLQVGILKLSNKRDFGDN